VLRTDHILQVNKCDDAHRTNCDLSRFTDLDRYNTRRTSTWANRVWKEEKIVDRGWLVSKFSCREHSCVFTTSTCQLLWCISTGFEFVWSFFTFHANFPCSRRNWRVAILLYLLHWTESENWRKRNQNTTPL